MRGFEPDQAIGQLNTAVPFGRIAYADEIADVIVYLSSAYSSCICGGLVAVNGGNAALQLVLAGPGIWPN